MADKNYEALARRIVGLEQRLEAFSRTRQLGNSSVTLTDGSDASVSGGVGAGSEAQQAIIGIDESLLDVDEINDAEVEHSVSVPEWIDHASPDAAWALATAVNKNVDDALDVAEQAAQDALKAQSTADGKNRVIASETEPVNDSESPFVQGDLWYETDGEGRFVGVHIWDGTKFNDYQIVADSVLVPGSVGNVLIKDGAVTAEKISAEAIDGKIISGAEIYGGYFEGGEFRLSDSEDIAPLWSHDCETLTDWSIRDSSGNIASGSQLTLVNDSETGSHSVLGTALEEQNNVGGPRYLALTAAYGAMPPGSVMRFRIKVTAPDPEILVSVRGVSQRTVARKLHTVPTDEWVTVHTEISSFGGDTTVLLAPHASVGDIQVDHAELVNQLSLTSGINIFRDSEGNATIESTGGETGEPLLISRGLFTGGNRFYSKAYLDLWTDAPDGTRAWVTADNREYVRRNGSWQRVPITLSGTVSITPSGTDASTPVNVSFPTGYFPSAPVVTTTPQTGVPHGSDVRSSATSITATGFTAVLGRRTAVTTTVHWIAVLN